MNLLSHLLEADAAKPRLTVYDEATDSRLDFSAVTLDNWAAKVGNMLIEEFDLDEDSRIAIDLPVSWQAVTIALGALAAHVDFTFGTTDDADVLFCSPDRVDASFTGDIALVTTDPFGRGVVETGGSMPDGVVDFGPTVRFYGDQFFGDTPALPALFDAAVIEPLAASRVLSAGWRDRASFDTNILAPLAAGGSVVVVSGLIDSARVEQIAKSERVTVTLLPI